MTIEKHKDKIICGDCLQVMKGMPDESIDLVVTSPPYNLIGSTGTGRASYWDSKLYKEGYDLHSDNMPMPDYIKWQRRCLTECLRLLKPTGAIFYNHKPRIQKGLLQTTLLEITAGFPVRQIIVWRKDGGGNFGGKSPTFFMEDKEFIYLIAKPKYKVRKPYNTLYKSIWHIHQGGKRTSEHPCPYPVELPRRAISASYGNIVLDPFIGSGTTAVAAVSEGWHYIGIDKSAAYCKQARAYVAAHFTGGEPLAVSASA